MQNNLILLTSIATLFKNCVMGRNDNRKTLLVRRRRSQAKKKARLKRLKEQGSSSKS